jgi:hypothetical protein
MRWLSKLVIPMFIISAATGSLGILETAAGQTPCERVEGWVLLFKTTEGCTSPVPLCTQGIFLSTNPNWNGANWFFTMLGSAPSVGLTAEVVPSSTVSYAGKVRITTLANGSIETSNTGVFDPVGGAFSQLDRVTGGTGRLGGAKGFIWLTGTGGDLIAGVRGEVRGNLCVSE